MHVHHAQVEAFARTKMLAATTPKPEEQPPADGPSATVDPAERDAAAAACELFCVLSVRALGLQRGLLQELLSAYGQAPTAARCVDCMLNNGGYLLIDLILIDDYNFKY